MAFLRKASLMVVVFLFFLTNIPAEAAKAPEIKWATVQYRIIKNKDEIPNFLKKIDKTPIYLKIIRIRFTKKMQPQINIEITFGGDKEFGNDGSLETKPGWTEAYKEFYILVYSPILFPKGVDTMKLNDPVRKNKMKSQEGIPLRFIENYEIKPHTED